MITDQGPVCCPIPSGQHPPAAAMEDSDPRLQGTMQSRRSRSSGVGKLAQRKRARSAAVGRVARAPRRHLSSSVRLPADHDQHLHGVSRRARSPGVVVRDTVDECLGRTRPVGPRPNISRSCSSGAAGLGSCPTARGSRPPASSRSAITAVRACRTRATVRQVRRGCVGAAPHQIRHPSQQRRAARGPSPGQPRSSGGRPSPPQAAPTRRRDRRRTPRWPRTDASSRMRPGSDHARRPRGRARVDSLGAAA